MISWDAIGCMAHVLPMLGAYQSRFDMTVYLFTCASLVHLRFVPVVGVW